MGLRLDSPRRAGGFVIAALCEHDAQGHRLAGGLGFSAKKHPVAIIIGSGSTLAAFAPDGTPADLAALERRFPGLRDQLENAR